MWYVTQPLDGKISLVAVLVKGTNDHTEREPDGVADDLGGNTVTLIWTDLVYAGGA